MTGNVQLYLAGGSLRQRPSDGRAFSWIRSNGQARASRRELSARITGPDP